MTIPVNKFGRNDDLNIQSMPAEIWNVGGIYIAPAAARVHDVVSSSADDAVAGLGARTLRIRGLIDWGGAEIEEVIAMDGITSVPTVNAYEIVNSMVCLTFGTERSNVGTISATARVDARIECQVDPGFGRSLMAVFGYSSIYTFVINSWFANFNRAGGQAATAELELCLVLGPDTDEFGLVMLHRLALAADGSSYIPHEFDPAVAIPGPGIVIVRAADVSVNNSEIGAGFEGFLR